MHHFGLDGSLGAESRGNVVNMQALFACDLNHMHSFMELITG